MNIMKKIIVIVLSLLAININMQADVQKRARIYILATGGTIAGSASTASSASYQPGVLSVDQIIQSVPDIEKVADLTGIQVANIASQNMTLAVWYRLNHVIDSLFTGNHADGVVITHGTDTMEESAYFLNLTLKHPNPVVLVGAMRPATAMSADGPANLYNAVSLAASKDAFNRGVMVVMNDYILSADDVTKNHTINVSSFISPNFGYLGVMRDSKPIFFRETMTKHTTETPFTLPRIEKMPRVEIVYAYAFASADALALLVDKGVDGIVIAGVGHGNYNDVYAKEIERAIKKGIIVVRSARVQTGGVDVSAEDYSPKTVVSGIKSPQKARILLMLSLCKSRSAEKIQTFFDIF